MKKYASFLTMLSLIMLPLCVSATSWGGGSGRGLEGGLFFGADLNRDERLDPKEAKSVKNLGEEEIFARYDEDKSGYITPLEFKEFMQQKPWLDKFVPPEDR